MAFLLCDPGWCVHISIERCSLTSRINGVTKKINMAIKGVFRWTHSIFTNIDWTHQGILAINISWFSLPNQACLLMGALCRWFPWYQRPTSVYTVLYCTVPAGISYEEDFQQTLIWPVIPNNTVPIKWKMSLADENSGEKNIGTWEIPRQL